MLPKEVGELPHIPGGWQTQEIDFHGSIITLSLPAQPDLFLDDEDVVAANDRNDYMPYWTFLWPAAIRMSQALIHAPWDNESHILELGAGLGLVGIAAMKQGSQVTFSDYDETALYLCRWNAIQNDLPEPETLTFDWRESIERTFPVIIGCEVNYDAAMHPVLFDLLDQMLMSDGVAWLGDPGRYQSPKFYDLARQRGYNVKILNEFGELITKPSSEGFQIFELTRNKN